MPNLSIFLKFSPGERIVLFLNPYSFKSKRSRAKESDFFDGLAFAFRLGDKGENSLYEKLMAQKIRVYPSGGEMP
jgi:hypothetical protein